MTADLGLARREELANRPAAIAAGLKEALCLLHDLRILADLGEKAA